MAQLVRRHVSSCEVGGFADGAGVEAGAHAPHEGQAHGVVLRRVVEPQVLPRQKECMVPAARVLEE